MDLFELTGVILLGFSALLLLLGITGGICAHYNKKKRQEELRQWYQWNQQNQNHCGRP